MYKSKVKEIRMRTKVTQRDIVDSTRIPVTIFRKIENGEWQPSSELEELIIRRIEDLECAALGSMVTPSNEISRENGRIYFLINKEYYGKIVELKVRVIG